jgi:hypothetical protein
MVPADASRSLPQLGLEVDRLAVLSADRRRLRGEILEIPHALLGEQVEGVPGLLIELNALAGRAYPAVAL